jgi:predicted DCC family thiol-disulfide oxidoreductase YuxK
MTSRDEAAPPACTVYFDGACPVCRAEIGWYRDRIEPGHVAFVDVAAAGCDPAPDLSRTAALARFHVRAADGTLVSGAPAFLALWRMTPRLAPVAIVLSVPPLPWLAEIGYRAFLRVRPLWRR